MITLSTGVSYFDLDFRRVPRIIATAIVHGSSGVAIVDPGPSSTLPSLRAGLEAAGIDLADVRALLLTHIHLDHAGATGTLVREKPDLRVYVHERGAPHLANPEKLLASAARLYGDEMETLWGEVLPVPHEALMVLQGSERISVAGRDFEVAYTPGHASHHVSYFNAETGIAFVGDTAGVRLNPGGFIVPPTPPPDIDLEAWRESLDRIGRWHPETLFITHFGPHEHPAAHMSELADHLEWASGIAKRLLAHEGSDEERESGFVDEIRRELRRQASEADVHSYEVAGRFDLNWRGIVRYWRKRQG